MPELKIEYLMAFAFFVLPGAISMYFFGLLVAHKDRLLKDRILEAVCFSLLNLAILVWPIHLLLPDGFLAQHPYWAWLLALVMLVFAPAIWPFAAHRFLRFAESRRLISPRSRTAWDDFFDSLRNGIWVQAVLTDGSVVGGVFGRDSFASSYPDPGHLYIQELWEIDSQGHFVRPENGSPGILLRPDDYRYVKVFRGDDDGGR